jgi:hypothetical protein
MDLSNKFSYSVNGKNSDTNHKSGQHLHADINAGARMATQWQVGMNGYLIRQTIDDQCQDPERWGRNTPA